MADGSLASAVAIPDQPSPDASKRRNSSITDHPEPDSKRRRLSSPKAPRNTDPDPAQSPDRKRSVDADAAADRPSRPAGGRDEERKRGRRLFGALLGTLSQSSSSAAQKRRADIERRQQDKLKLQDEEYGELTRKRREERAAVRRKAQRAYDEESMRTRHANLLAMARFLKTKSEPVLYYKPWQLRPGDEDTIRDQIDQAEATIAREAAEFETRYPPQDPEKQPDETAPATETPGATAAPAASDTVGADTNLNDRGQEARTDDAPTNESHDAVVAPDPTDEHRADDDGGEVVEDQEDTVEY
ncbi:pinin/SDK/memA/ protein conserved region-domain-containing protein [Aspergillus ambiguus]|uniref:pinin family protein n=1 Tax=Aspergillus ambiguus TaxID=176160 RepID=UPI003CCE34EE